MLDLRKFGFIPVAGFLQPAGIVHHMTLDAVLDPATRILEHLEGGQPTRAFEPSALTEGECCSDPLPRLASLVGENLDDRFVGKLQRVFGGPLGCSHLVTLAQLMTSALVQSLAWNERQPRASQARRTGERIYCRAVEIDGFEAGEGQIQVVVQLTDVHFVAAPEISVPMRQFGAESEVRLSATVDVANGMLLGRLEGFERSREHDDLEAAQFIDRTEALQFLDRQSIMEGVSKRILGALAANPADRAFLDAALMLAPGFVQCLASLSERWPAYAKANPSLLGVCGRANSCYMWRDGGPVRRAGEQETRGRAS